MLNRSMTFILLLLMLVLSGCSLIPHYTQPQLPVAENWPVGDAYLPVSSGEAAQIAWQDYVQSVPLKRLIDRVLANNRDLRIAALNIEQVRAAYRIQRSELIPTISVNGSVTRAEVPEDTSTNGVNYNYTAISANVALASYELDFFGRVRSLNQQALENYLATEEAFASARVSLIAETANAYLGYLADRKLLQLARETQEAQQKTYKVIERQFEVGSATRLDLVQVATAVESAKVSISQYTRQLAQDKNALIYLAGGPVDDFLNNEETIDTIRFMVNLPAGLPSEVLLARPDIRMAEHQLKAANADIGAARAALYPAISLTGAFGLASDGLDGLFSSGARYAWNFTPSLTIPIFNRGKLKASLAAAEVNEKIAATHYELAIQTAFREVADQLAARGTYQAQLDAQNALVAATGQAFELSKARYDNGIDDFLTVLDSQRSLFSAKQGVVNSKLSYLANLVSLYKALGGGQL